MQSQLTHYVKYIVSILLVFLLISCAQDDELLPTISKINKTDYQKKEEIADQEVAKKDAIILDFYQKNLDGDYVGMGEDQKASASLSGIGKMGLTGNSLITGWMQQRSAPSARPRPRSGFEEKDALTKPAGSGARSRTRGGLAPFPPDIRVAEDGNIHLNYDPSWIANNPGYTARVPSSLGTYNISWDRTGKAQISIDNPELNPYIDERDSGQRAPSSSTGRVFSSPLNRTPVSQVAMSDARVRQQSSPSTPASTRPVQNRALSATSRSFPAVYRPAATPITSGRRSSAHKSTPLNYRAIRTANTVAGNYRGSPSPRFNLVNSLNNNDNDNDVPNNAFCGQIEAYLLTSDILLILYPDESGLCQSFDAVVARKDSSDEDGLILANENVSSMGSVKELIFTNGKRGEIMKVMSSYEEFSDKFKPIYFGKEDNPLRLKNALEFILDELNNEGYIVYCVDIVKSQCNLAKEKGEDSPEVCSLVDKYQQLLEEAGTDSQ